MNMANYPENWMGIGEKEEFIARALTKAWLATKPWAIRAVQQWGKAGEQKSENCNPKTSRTKENPYQIDWEPWGQLQKQMYTYNTTQ